tara:strand:- start:12070 stop:13698 length:1629 start_codon:yes stop_codon:yes gene_type:complete
VIKNYINFLQQKFSRNSFFSKIILSIFKLRVLIFLSKRDKKIINQWTKYKNIKNKKFKGYLIYNCTIDQAWMGFHLQQIFFLQVFYSLGYIPIILNSYNLEKVYKNLGYICLKNIFTYIPTNTNFKLIRKRVTNIKNTNFLWNGINCGKLAKNSALRELKLSNLDFKNINHLKVFRFYLIKSILYIESFNNLKKIYKINNGLFNDHDMCGEGEIFQSLISSKFPQFSITAGYKNNTFYLKKYFKKNKFNHPRSLSKKTLKMMSKEIFNYKKRKKLNNEIFNTYKKKEWEIFAKTQTKTKFKNIEEVKKILNLDENKKNVVIFSHIFYDATFSWGINVFRDYEEWLIESVSALCKNSYVNPILKIHPANISKSNNKFTNNEIKALKKLNKGVPKNLKIINPNSTISTHSIIKMMDACITVRGTVGIEAAAKEKLLITCGSGRYDRLGFSLDFNNKVKYLKYLKNSKFEVTKKINFTNGQKFAYYTLFKRPFFPKTKISHYDKSNRNFPINNFKPSDMRSIKFNNDKLRIKKWIKDNNEDFIDN